MSSTIYFKPTDRDVNWNGKRLDADATSQSDRVVAVHDFDVPIVRHHRRADSLLVPGVDLERAETSRQRRRCVDRR